MRTNCNLAQHIANQLLLAKVKGETVEAARLERDMQEHVSKCMTCAGLYRPLEDQLFGTHVIVRGAEQ